MASSPAPNSSQQQQQQQQAANGAAPPATQAIQPDAVMTDAAAAGAASSPAPNAASTAAGGGGGAGATATGSGRGTPARGTPVPQQGDGDAATMPGKARPHGAPTRQYLNENVTGPLLEGMRMLAVRKPQQPLRALADFLLERSRELEAGRGGNGGGGS